MVSRRQFLRGKEGTAALLRPPQALAEDAFVECCTRCDACVEACPTGIIRRGDGGFPEVDFARGVCTFCNDCVRACKPAALAAKSAAWALRVEIGDSCIAQANVVCRSCGDRCDVRAIRFPPLRGAAALPVVDETHCTGCGACFSACPVSAITLRPATAAAITA